MEEGRKARLLLLKEIMFFYNLLRSGAPFWEILICVAAMLIALSISIVSHEVAHGYAALKCGDPTAKVRGRLTLNPLAHFDLMGILMMLIVGFGWAKPVPIDPRNFKNYKRDMLIVSTAGVAVNLVYAGLGFLVLFLARDVLLFTSGLVALKLFFFYFLVFFISLNCMLAFFNLLPIYPLDGFRVLNEFLPRGNKYSEFMYKYGFYVIIAIVLLGYVFDALGLWYLDIFGAVSKLINKLINLVLGG